MRVLRRSKHSFAEGWYDTGWQMSQANQTKGIDRVMAVMVRIMEVCSLIGIFSIGAIMVITTMDVLGRYLFNVPLPATYELTECAVAGAVFLGIAYTQFRKGHVQMEIVVLHLSQRGKPLPISCIYFWP